MSEPLPVSEAGDEPKHVPNLRKLAFVADAVKKIDSLDNGRPKSSTHKRQDQQDVQLHFLLPGYAVTEPRLLTAIERASREFETKEAAPNDQNQIAGTDAALVLQILNVIRSSKDDGPSKICFDVS